MHPHDTGIGRIRTTLERGGGQDIDNLMRRI